MSKIEAIFLWAGIWCYGFSFVFFLFGVVFKKEKWIKWGWYLTIAGFAFQTSNLGARWIITGHPPVMRVYENSMLGSWFIVSLFIMVRFWQKKLDVIGVAVMPIVLMMIGNGVMGRPIHEPLSPPYKSNWLWLHIFFAWISYGAFCISAGMGVLYLLKERAEKAGNLSSFYGRLPVIGIINDITLKTVIFGFITLTVQIGAGALWAYDLWGRYWNWDPIENWSLITWLVYGIYIHLAATLGWKGRRMAWLAIIFLAFVFITFGGIGFIGGVHTPIM